VSEPAEDKETATYRWLVTTLIAGGCLYFGWEGNELTRQHYREQQLEKSRPKKTVVRKGDRVLITIEKRDAMGFITEQTIDCPEEEWAEFYKELEKRFLSGSTR
jgi:hypothetical protein